MTEEYIGRSRRRKQSGDLNRYLVKLCQQPPIAIKNLQLPGDVEDEILSTQKMKVGKARNRQIKFLGRVIRCHDHHPLILRQLGLELPHIIDDED